VWPCGVAYLQCCHLTAAIGGVTIPIVWRNGGGVTAAVAWRSSYRRLQQRIQPTPSPVIGVMAGVTYCVSQPFGQLSRNLLWLASCAVWLVTYGRIYLNALLYVWQRGSVTVAVLLLACGIVLLWLSGRLSSSRVKPAASVCGKRVAAINNSPISLFAAA